MSEIEFLPEDPGDAGATEELAGGPRQSFPRWLGGAGLAVVVAAAVAVAVHRGDPAGPDRAASAAPTVATSRAAAPPTRPHNRIGLPLDQGEGTPIRDVATAADNTWLLQNGGIIRIGADGQPLIAELPAPPQRDDPDLLRPRLVLDQAARRLWVVMIGGPYGRVIEYDAYSLHVLRDIRATPGIASAAALAGRLYLAAGRKVIEVGDVERTVAAFPGQLGALVADPTRNRLLAADIGASTRVWAIEPTTGRARVSAPGSVRVTKASLAVVGASIWLAGFDTGAGVLMGLDPHTLLPAGHSTLDPLLEPGAAIVGAGSGVIWVRDGGAGSELRCIDAGSGRQAQSWTVDGRVASTFGRAVVATASGAVPLELDTCAG